MKKGKIAAIGVLTAVSVIGIFVISFFTVDQADKETVVVGHADWMDYTFDFAANQATTIVYGEVVSKGKMHIEYEDGKPFRYDTKVSVKVIEWVKGDMKSSKITFLEMGGETRTAIYVYNGITPVQTGERYVFFLNEYGAFLNPQTLIPVADGRVSTSENIFPKETVLEVPPEAEDVSVEDYLEAVRTVLW